MEPRQISSVPMLHWIEDACEDMAGSEVKERQVGGNTRRREPRERSWRLPTKTGRLVGRMGAQEREGLEIELDCSVGSEPTSTMQ